MATWATSTDVTNQFPATFLNKLTGGDDDVLTAILAAAEGEVAAHLKRRYPNQVANRTASTTVKTIVVMLALRKLHNRNPLMAIAKSLYDDIEFNVNLLKEIRSAEADVPEWQRPNGFKTGSMEFESQTTFQDWLQDREVLED